MRGRVEFAVRFAFEAGFLSADFFVGSIFDLIFPLSEEITSVVETDGTFSSFRLPVAAFEVWF